MTQPPEEPPEEPPGDQPEEPWQPPTPPPQQPPQHPPQQPPPGHTPGYGLPYDRPPPPPPNPYGGGTVSYYQPIESGGMPAALKVVLGVLIGLGGGFFLWIVAVFGLVGIESGDSGNSGDSGALFFYAAVLPLVVPALLLIPKPTRPWAVGIMIGTAITSIGMSSVCSALIGA